MSEFYHPFEAQLYDSCTTMSSPQFSEYFPTDWSAIPGFKLASIRVIVAGCCNSSGRRLGRVLAFVGQ
jgi:hypothetical protein